MTSVCLSLLLLLCPCPASAQADTLWGDHPFTAETAEKALREGTANLLIMGGLGGSSTNGRKEKHFKKKYGIGYCSFDCVVPASEQELREYNEVLYNWLTERYGDEWLKSVREDVLGLEKWKLYKDAVPYELVDTKPTFNGGTLTEFSLWVNRHLQLEYGDQHVESSRVVVRFLLSEEGEIQDVENVGPYTLLCRSVIKTIRQSPSWTPGAHKGLPCRVVVTIPATIDFFAP